MRPILLFGVCGVLGACGNAVGETSDVGPSRTENYGSLRGGTSAEQHAGHAVADDADRARADCVPELDGLVPDVAAVAGAGQTVTVPPARSNDVDCAAFAWAALEIRGRVAIEPAWGGLPITTSQWDCNHSSLEFAVYQRSGAGWYYVAGGLGYGALNGERCSYSVANFPPQSGVDSVTISAEDGPSLLVAVRSWSHNDTALGHPGDACFSESCFWPVHLQLVRD